MPIYEFRCDTCCHMTEAFRRLGDTQPPACLLPGHAATCGLRLVISRTRQIVRPHGYSLQPGDTGYWDFADVNEPGYRPPVRAEPGSAWYAAEADIERAERNGDEEWSSP